MLDGDHSSYYGWTRYLSHLFSEKTTQTKEWKKHENDEYDQLLTDFQDMLDNCGSQDGFEAFQKTYNSLLKNDQIEQLTLFLGG